jgi:uncharacterized membrane protein
VFLVFALQNQGNNLSKSGGMSMAHVPEPVDRREVVREDRAPGYVRRERVIKDANAERELTLDRVAQFIWLVFGIIIGLIGLRVLLRLIVANPANTFADFIYYLTGIFLGPFFGLTNTPTTTDGIALEISSLIAMVVYALVAYVLVKLVYVLFSKSSARKVETYERD